MKKVNKFKVVECSGSPYEIGFQWGEGCKENILQALQMTIGGLSMGYQASKDDILANAMKFHARAKDFDPDLMEILRGQADAVGVSFEEIFALKCGFDLGANFGQLSGLCTSFAVTGEATADGKTILGQNVDWFPGTPMDLVKITYPNGLVQLSLVLWGIVEYSMSTAGFGMNANGTWAAPNGFRLNMPIGCYLPKAMRQKSLNDAMNILRNNARGMGYYHLASKTGELMGIESVWDDFEIISPENNTLAHANHYLTERFKAVDMVNVIIPDSLNRVERMKTLLADNYGKITSYVMMEVLADHSNLPNAICRHVDESKPPMFHSETLASFIMVPEDGIMYVAHGTPCCTEFVEYKL